MTLEKKHPVKLKMHYKELSLLAGVAVAIILVLLYWLSGSLSWPESSAGLDVQLPSPGYRRLLEKMVSIIRH